MKLRRLIYLVAIFTAVALRVITCKLAEILGSSQKIIQSLFALMSEALKLKSH